MPASHFLIIGLGNPGAEYADTRHNIGFIALDLIAKNAHAMPWKNKFQAQVTTGVLEQTGKNAIEHDVMLLKPQTFMNLSGDAVGAAAGFYKIAPSQIIVFHDEIDLPVGEIRVKKGGGHAGHNGLKSIDAHIGPDYHRVRIGVGHPGQRDMVSGHVLGALTQDDKNKIMPVLEKFIDGFAAFLGGL